MAEGTQRDDGSQRGAPLPNPESNESKEWEVARILDSRIEKKADGVFETKFLVEWVQNGEEKWDNTWEPFEIVSHLPLLMKQFRSFSKAKIVDPMGTISQDTLNAIAPFPVPPKEILSAFKLPEEIIPKGSETVVDIVFEKGEGNKKLWAVIFKEHSFITFVRKPLMIYLFPVQSCYFMMDLKKKFEKLEGAVRGK